VPVIMGESKIPVAPGGNPITLKLMVLLKPFTGEVMVAL
jgi:hypothetical protein